MAPQAAYKDGSHALQRVIDWLLRFTDANERLIKDHDDKVHIGKKTRRKVPDSLFREATKIMG